MNPDLVYQIALTRIPGIGPVHAALLLKKFHDPARIFRATRHTLETCEGIGPVRAAQIAHFRDFSGCESELRFMEQYGITPLFLPNSGYPERLRHCPDAPLMLYYKGKANLNPRRVVAVAGTRSNTPEGKERVERLVCDLAAHDILVISGLAYGIDTLTHRAALQHQVPTVAVLAHGLDRLYPAVNRALAAEMTQQGGLITEFGKGTAPDKPNFPYRNRIIAGLSDALVVVESGERGGSLITAQMAFDYHRDVFSFPGRPEDRQSRGCLHLIRNHQARLITSAADLLNDMGWTSAQESSKPKRNYDGLCEEEKRIISALKHFGQPHIDTLGDSCQLPPGPLATHLLSLEMRSMIRALPGQRYCLS